MCAVQSHVAGEVRKTSFGHSESRAGMPSAGGLSRPDRAVEMAPRTPSLLTARTRWPTSYDMIVQASSVARKAFDVFGEQVSEFTVSAISLRVEEGDIQ